MAARKSPADFRNRVLRLATENNQGHVIVLLGPRYERIGGLHNVGDGFRWAEAGAVFDRLDEALFAPLFVGVVHGLANAVSEGEEDISRFDLQSALLVGKALE